MVQIESSVARGRGLIFTYTHLESHACVIDIEQVQDLRGFFARTVCIDEFKKNGINGRFIQQSISFNPNAGTLRGMHWQSEPFSEEKLVRVTRGAIFDVVVDIRLGSSTFGKWFAVELSSENRRQIYIPKGLAHGFQTLEDNTEVLYQMTAPHTPDAARGFSWSDPKIGIIWPSTPNRIIGTRDSMYGNLVP